MYEFCCVDSYIVATKLCVECSEGKPDAISVGSLDPPFTACVVRIITGEVRRGERSVPSIQVNRMIGTSSICNKQQMDTYSV